MEDGLGFPGRDRSPFSTSHQYAPRLTGLLVGLLTGRLVVEPLLGPLLVWPLALLLTFPPDLRLALWAAALLAAAFPAAVYGYLTPPTVGILNLR